MDCYMVYTDILRSRSFLCDYPSVCTHCVSRKVSCPSRGRWKGEEDFDDGDYGLCAGLPGVGSPGPEKRRSSSVGPPYAPPLGSTRRQRLVDTLEPFTCEVRLESKNRQFVTRLKILEI